MTQNDKISPFEKSLLSPNVKRRLKIDIANIKFQAMKKYSPPKTPATPGKKFHNKLNLTYRSLNSKAASPVTVKKTAQKSPNSEILTILVDNDSEDCEAEKKRPAVITQMPKK